MQSTFPLLLVLAAAVPAQQVWVVDQQYGAGAHTRDIPSAVQMAADGDKILVRAGVYSATIVQGKSLTFVGEAGAEVRPSQAEAGFAILDLTAQQQVSIRGFLIRERTTGGAAGIYLYNNRGTVHLEALRVAQVQIVGLHIETSDTVSVLDVQVSGGVQCAFARQSNVAMSQCQLIAGVAGAVGLEALDSTMVLSDCDVRGGDAISSTWGPAMGLVATNSTITLGHAGTSVVAGTGNGASALPTEAVRASGGILVYDPSITLQPSHGGPPINASGTSVRAQMVATLTRQTPSQGVLSPLEVRGNAGDAAFSLVSLLRQSQATPFGRVFVDPVAFLLVDAGILDASGSHVFSLPRPPMSLGTPLILQTMLLDASNVLTLGTPLAMSY
ncbi:MAG: hypothetical protein R3F56_11385 [Planctomycetota bacterium]